MTNEKTTTVEIENVTMNETELYMLHDYWEEKFENYQGKYDDATHRFYDEKVALYAVALEDLNIEENA